MLAIVPDGEIFPARVEERDLFAAGLNQLAAAFRDIRARCDSDEVAHDLVHLHGWVHDYYDPPRARQMGVFALVVALR
jgi:hypothetical protein